MQKVKLDAEDLVHPTTMNEVIIVYDPSSAAFQKSALIVKKMYDSLGANSVVYPLTLANVSVLEDFSVKPRILIHYIGHGSNDGVNPYPRIQVIYLLLLFILSSTHFFSLP